MKYKSPINDNTTAHRSADYDDQICQTIPYYQAFHEETIQLIKTCQPEPSVWLDTGCGTGALVQKCLAAFPAATYILSDPAASMLEIARAKFAEQDNRVSFLEPAATADIPSNLRPRPTVITAIQAHHYLSESERHQATMKCYDLLDADGIFITFENVLPMTAAGVDIGKRYWERYQLSSGRTKSQTERQLARLGCEFFPITIQKHLELYKKCGFKTVELFWLSYMQAGFYCLK
ncbi:class I SAM-dependent methyltransferase [Oscillospiraceae bacterium WX1]